MPHFRRRIPRTDIPRTDESPPTGPVDMTLGEPVDAVPVLLSPGVVDLALPLGQALGPGYSVQVEGRGAAGVMIVGPLGAAGVAFLRASHPGVVLLVVDRRGPGPRPADAVVHLEAGADGHLAGAPVAEVASHIRALARRARPTAA